MTQATPRIALVTGATRGIGAAIAQELAQRGYTVIGTATSDEGAQRISAALTDQGGRGVKLDVNDAASVDALIDSMVKTEWRPARVGEQRRHHQRPAWPCA